MDLELVEENGELLIDEETVDETSTVDVVSEPELLIEDNYDLEEVTNNEDQIFAQDDLQEITQEQEVYTPSEKIENVNNNMLSGSDPSEETSEEDNISYKDDLATITDAIIAVNNNAILHSQISIGLQCIMLGGFVIYCFLSGLMK